MSLRSFHLRMSKTFGSVSGTMTRGIRRHVSSHQHGKRFYFPPTLQSVLSSRIDSERDRVKKVMKGQFGKMVLGESTIERCIEGGRDIPAIYAQYDGTELQAKMKTFLSTEKTFEGVLWYLLSNSGHNNATPSSKEIQEFTEHLQERRIRRLLSENAIVSLLERTQTVLTTTLPDEITGQVVLAMLLMHQQPYSQFYLHRKETKKTDLHVLILEDILDLIATLPDLISLANKIVVEKKLKTKQESTWILSPSSSSSSSGECSPLAERVKGLLHNGKNSEATLVQQAVVGELIRSFDGGNVLIHTPRLVSCTLSDPYLALTSTVLAFHTVVNYGQSQPHTQGVNEYRLSLPIGSANSEQGVISDQTVVALVSRLTAGLVEVYWDRALMFSLENPKSMDLPSFETVLSDSC